MSYDPNKPIVTDSPAYDVAQIQTNFAEIKTLIDVNHVDFDLSGAGKHSIVHFPNLTPTSGTIPAATLSNEYAMYSTSAGLFIRPPSQSAGPQTPSLDVNITSPAGQTANGWTVLPSGLKMRWGKGLATCNAYTAVTYATSGFPGFASTPYSLQLTVAAISSIMSGKTGSIYVNAETNLGFNAYWNTSTTTNADFYYLAIGV
jgi:hypothetical protein